MTASKPPVTDGVSRPSAQRTIATPVQTRLRAMASEARSMANRTREVIVRFVRSLDVCSTGLAVRRIAVRAPRHGPTRSAGETRRSIQSGSRTGRCSLALHAVASGQTPSGKGASDGPSGALRLTPLPALRMPAFPLRHLYVEVVYAPLLGPAAVLVAKNLGRHLDAERGPVTVSIVDIAFEVGLRASHDEPLGQRSRLRHAIDRLVHDHIVQWLGPADLGVHTSVPIASERALAKLPQAAREAHYRFVADLQSKARTEQK